MKRASLDQAEHASRDVMRTGVSGSQGDEPGEKVARAEHQPRAGEGHPGAGDVRDTPQITLCHTITDKAAPSPPPDKVPGGDQTELHNCSKLWHSLMEFWTTIDELLQRIITQAKGEAG